MLDITREFTETDVKSVKDSLGVCDFYPYEYQVVVLSNRSTITVGVVAKDKDLLEKIERFLLSLES